MKPELILQSDLLDLLFEGRNKSYGAYALRRGYDRRLIISLSAMLLAVGLFLFLQRLWGDGDRHAHAGAISIPEGPTLQQFIIDPPPQSPAPRPAPRAALQNASPVIVKDNLATNQLHTMEELDDDVVIGTQDILGDKFNTVEPPAELGTGAGPEKPEPAPVEKAPEVLYRADVMPEFPGGEAALKRFLQRNLKVPDDNLEAGRKVLVRARFIVNEQGEITGIAMVSSGGELFDREVKRVLMKMPAWKPGRQAGRPVKVYFTLPVVFQTYE